MLYEIQKKPTNCGPQSSFAIVKDPQTRRLSTHAHVEFYFKMEPAQHILTKHWQPLQWDGQSIFLGSFSERIVIELIHETIENPDVVERHRTRVDRRVKKKKFEMAIGVHGIKYVPCYSVTVIFNFQDGEIITP